MADGNAGGEWCSFAEFTDSEFNSTQIDNSDTDNSFTNQQYQGDVEANEAWNANFDNAFTVKPTTDNNNDIQQGNSWNFANNNGQFVFNDECTFLDQHPLEKEIDAITETCFYPVTLLQRPPEERECCCLNQMYINSKLPSLLQLTGYDPVKSEDTQFHQLKIEKIVPQLHIDQAVENWISMLNKINTRLYEDDFDYHSNINKDKKMVTQSNQTVQNGGKQITQNGVPIKATIFTDNSISIDKKVESNLRKVNTHSKSALPLLENDMRKTSEELQEKSLDEVKNIIYELQIQANIYSELLLNELDYRDKLKRDIEGQNNFISSYVAVERKMNDNQQSKKKKSRYGFFKQNEEETKQPVSIPYIQRDGGPKPDDLGLMTEILKAVERDDQGVSKLISDYVINLGDQHNLQTVIQVRTCNGVTSLSTPEHKKKSVGDDV